MSGRQIWTAEADRDLLIAMYNTMKPTGEQLQRVVDFAAAEMGYSFTHKALTQHLQKLRRAAPGTAAAGATTPKGPATPKPKSAKSRKATPKRKKEETDEDDDEMPVDTPSKKIKDEHELSLFEEIDRNDKMFDTYPAA